MTIQMPAYNIERFLDATTTLPNADTPMPSASTSIKALIHGDNLEFLQEWEKRLAGSIDLIYIDPPFATSNKFRAGKIVGSTMSAPKNWDLAYSDTFTLDGYLEFLKPRIVAMRHTLSDVGSFYIHTDVKVGHYVKVLMDQIFGRENFRNEITRIKCNPKNFERRGFGNIKDTILFYTKGNDYIWNEPRAEPDIDSIFARYNKVLPDGRRYTTTPLHAPGETVNGSTGEAWRGKLPPPGRHWRYPPSVLEQLDRDGLIEWSSTGNPRKVIFADDAIASGIKMQDVWTFKDPQRATYPTEKNIEVLETIVSASSEFGSIVMDAFCGSGTTLIAAHNQERSFIGIDQSDIAIRACERRMPGIVDYAYCYTPGCDLCSNYSCHGHQIYLQDECGEFE